jgi:predicted nucleotidyltransferase
MAGRFSVAVRLQLDTGMAMDASVGQILRTLQQGLAGLYGDRLIRLVLFGSHARGEAGPGSDLDVLVVLKGPVDAGQEIERTGALVAALSLRHDVVISCVFMDDVRFSQRQGPFLRNVRREGISL